MALPLIASHGLQAHPSLCDAKDEAVFSCPIERGKFISVCMHEKETGVFQAQYRIGQKGRLEFALPGPASASLLQVEGNQSSGARGGDSFIRFASSSEYVYTVWDSWGAPAMDQTGCPARGCSNSGVVVERSGKIVSRKRCPGPGIPFEDGVLVRYGIVKSEHWPR